jgi:23S rRNA (uracil1939-C5)-methyltransferase
MIKKSLAPDQSIIVEILRLGVHGEGVGEWDQWKIYVHNAFPQEIVQVVITEVKTNYATARIERILKPSIDRIQPPCPHVDRCGGCQLMPLNYQAQLTIKTRRVKEAFSLYDRLSPISIPLCIPSPAQLKYRTKIQTPVEVVELEKAGKERDVRIGFYARNSKEIIPIQHCSLHSDLGQRIYQRILFLLQSNAEIEGLRYLLIKEAYYSKEALVTFITNRRDIEGLADLAFSLALEFPEIKGVMQNINQQQGNVVLGEEFRLLAGESYMEETLLGLRLRLSSASFFQVNPQQASNVYQTVVEWADLTGIERVIDAYCGVGGMALLLASYAKESIGIEWIEQAIKDANFNAQLNGIQNATFYCGEAEKVISQFDQIDCLILNPPRKGCHVALIQAIANLNRSNRPKTILYVSCEPSSLARDIDQLLSIGYRVDQVQPFDMFPQTVHVETVLKLVST